jgi:enamine deaminase RidA (YjgF/YER057c/UK114 family)
MRTLCVSGQFGVWPDGSVPSDFADQTSIAMANVERLLRTASMSRDGIVKLNFYLTRVQDLPELGRIRRKRWACDVPPAVTVLVVSALARPEYLIESEAIAAANA